MTHGLLAYLDPGTGSFFLQILAGGLFGSLFFVKQSWRKIKSNFSGSSSRPDNQPQEA